MKLRKMPTVGEVKGTLQLAREVPDPDMTQAVLGQHSRLGTRFIAQLETPVNSKPARKPGPRMVLMMRSLGVHWRSLVN